MKAVIIDDSRLARKELVSLIEEVSSLSIVAEASNADEAIDVIHQFKPDVIFLDIQMPGKSGFEMLEELDESPIVIFTTAYDEYALKAFEYNALDYLQKPILDKRLIESIEKAYDKKAAMKQDVESTPEQLASDAQVFVKDGDDCWFVKISDIQLFEIDGNYTRIYFENEKPLIQKSLNYLESRLSPKFYFRANRQQIVNLKWIDRVEPWFSGGLKLFLKGGQGVEVSRRQTSVFKDLMSF